MGRRAPLFWAGLGYAPKSLGLVCVSYPSYRSSSAPYQLPNSTMPLGVCSAALKRLPSLVIDTSKSSALMSC